MARMRVYLPATLRGLSAQLPAADASAAGSAAAAIVPAGTIGYAVTPALREWYREGDLEELEYAAMSHAARAALRLLRSEPAAAPRRVVLAAEVADGDVAPAPADDDVAAVVLGTAVPLSAVAAVHVDDVAAEADVAAALAALDAAHAGDADAAFVVDAVDDHELQWYGVQELRFLLG
jgi:hypothetical protein